MTGKKRERQQTDLMPTVPPTPQDVKADAAAYINRKAADPDDAAHLLMALGLEAC